MRSFSWVIKFAFRVRVRNVWSLSTHAGFLSPVTSSTCAGCFHDVPIGTDPAPQLCRFSAGVVPARIAPTTPEPDTGRPHRARLVPRVRLRTASPRRIAITQSTISIYPTPKIRTKSSLRTHRRSARKPREVAREQRIARAAVAVAEVATAIPRFAAKHRPRVLRPLTTANACGGSGHCDPRRGQVARALRPLERPDRRERRRARVRARATIRTRCRDWLRLARRNAVHRARGGGWGTAGAATRARARAGGRVEAVGWVRGGRYA